MGARLAKAGLWLQFAPLVDIVPVIRRMWAVFQEMQARMLETGGLPDPVLLTQMVRAAVTGSYFGTGVSLIGALLILLAYTRYGHRPAWAGWFLAAFAVLAVLSLALMWL